MEKKRKIQKVRGIIRWSASCLFLVFCFYHVPLRAQDSARIDLKLTKATLEKVFKEIERQTSCMFVYKTEEVRAVAPVTLEVKGALVSDVLERCLKNTGLSYQFKKNVVVIQKQMKDAPRGTTQVFGVVTDEHLAPLPGVTIMVKGESIGTSTDNDGKFVLKNVPRSAKILVASFIGMESQEVAIHPGSIKIMLKDKAEMLDETIVVAFGTQKKSSFSGAVAVVGEQELKKRISTNVANVLVGTTPGLQLRGGSGAPGAGAGSIKIRGIASMYAGTSPLIIVDGAPYSASLSNIPQEDIESVTVLKDAVSAALYGARGAAGVIMITTKSGKGKKPEINVNVKLGVNSRAIQDYETINDPGEYYEVMYKQYYNYFVDQKGLSPEKANADANTLMLKHLSYNIYTVPDGQYLIDTDGKLNPNATLGRSYEANGENYYLINDDWQDLAYSNAFRQEYNVSIDGSMNNGSFYASLGYLDEDGIIEYSGYKRFSARVKADYQAKKWLKLGANVSYTNSVTESNPNMGTSLNSSNLMFYTSGIAPIYPVFVRVLDENGNPQIRIDENGNPQYDYGVAATNYPGFTRAFMATGNPMGSNRYNETLSKGNKLNGAFSVDVNLMSNLKFSATSTLDWGNTVGSWYENSLYGSKVSVNGTISKSQQNTFRQNHVQTLTYFDQYGLNSVSLMLGHEYYNNKLVYLGANAQGVFSPDIKEINAAAKPLTSNSYTSEYNVEGYFVHLSYDYDAKYFASFSYRCDASSKFAKDSRWGNFWSVGGTWLINKESFFEVGWVNQLKVKFSIGQQGNDNIDSFAYTDMYSLIPASETVMSAKFSRIGNPDITWETTTNMNTGVEFTLFNNRLAGSVDYYRKKTTDLLFWISIPESGGARGYYGNVGDIRNSGVEVSLQGSVIRTDNVDWTLMFNIAHNKDKILKLPKAKTTEFGGFVDQSIWYKEGGSLYNQMYRQYAGVNEKGEAVYWVDDELGRGVTNRPGKRHDSKTTDPNEATRYELGSSLPDAYGGFGTSLTVHGFDLSLSFDYQLGGRIYDSRYAYLMGNIASTADAGHAVHKDVLKSWTSENSSSSIPRFQYGDQYTTAASDRWLTSARYLNFQSFSLGYTLPERWVSRLSIRKLRIYVSGENLCFWSARKGLDPRYSYTSSESLNVYSPVRTILGGLQLVF